MRALLLRGSGVVGRGLVSRCVAVGRQETAGIGGRRWASELSNVLSGEIEAEMENMSPDAELDAAVAKLESSGASISHKEGSGRVSITLSENVGVSFDCRDVEADEEGDDEEEQAGSIEFDVSIEKDGNRLVFECLASDGVQIDAVSFYRPGDDEEDKDVYDGPTFDELDADLQAAFYNYLEGYGVNSDLCALINMYATRKETTEYVNWLNGVKKFVE